MVRLVFSCLPKNAMAEMKELWSNPWQKAKKPEVYGQQPPDREALQGENLNYQRA